MVQFSETEYKVSGMDLSVSILNALYTVVDYSHLDNFEDPKAGSPDHFLEDSGLSDHKERNDAE